MRQLYLYMLILYIHENYSQSDVKVQHEFQSCLWQASFLGLLPGIGRSLCYEASWVQIHVSQGNEDVKQMYGSCKSRCRAMLEREYFCSLLLRAGLHWSVSLGSYPRATLPLSQWEHLTKACWPCPGHWAKMGAMLSAWLVTRRFALRARMKPLHS